jgi:hypothetical protein
MKKTPKVQYKEKGWWIFKRLVLVAPDQNDKAISVKLKGER